MTNEQLTQVSILIKAGTYTPEDFADHLQNMTAFDYDRGLFDHHVSVVTNDVYSPLYEVSQDFIYTPIQPVPQAEPQIKNVWEEGVHEFIYVDNQDAVVLIRSAYEQAKLKLTGSGSFLGLVIAEGRNVVGELYPTESVVIQILEGDE